MKRKRLGELLRERGSISTANLDQLFLEQNRKVIRLGELVLERGLVDKPTLVDALQEVLQVGYVDCTDIRCEPAALDTVPVTIAQRFEILPIRGEPFGLIVAMAEPQNLAIIEELRAISGKNILPRLGFRVEILLAISRNYGEPVAKTTKAKRVLRATRSMA